MKELPHSFPPRGWKRTKWNKSKKNIFFSSKTKRNMWE